MDYESDVEDERSEFNTSEVDWGEEPDPSWSGEEGYDPNSWEGGADSEFSTGEGYERNKEHWDDETESESALYEEEDLGVNSSQIGLEEETDVRDEEKSESSFCEEVGYHDSLEDKHHEFDLQNKSRDEQRLKQHAYEEESSFAEDESCHDEEENYEETGSEHEEEDRPWCEIPYFNYEDETESQRSPEEFVEEEEVKIEAGRDDFEEAYIKEDEDIAEEPRYIQFSGHEPGPEAYLHWENDMENWFRSQHIPKEDMLSYALDTLVGEAQEWWQQEDFWRQNSQPINTWGLLKQSMYRKFVPKSLNKSYTPKKFLFQSAPKERSVPKQPYSSKLKRRTTPAPIKRTEATLITQAQEEKPMAKVVAHKQSPSSMLEPHGEPKQCKSPKLSKSKEIICYRCHKQGHFAATCPERQVVNVTTLEPKQSSSNSSNCLVQSGFEISNSSIMCLSSPRVNDAGLDQVMEHTVRKVGPEKDEFSPSFILMQEEPPDFKKTPNAPSDTKSSWTRGMTLNSQRRMKANLLSLSADYQVSRSKLCQGGGYDEAIRSDLTGEHTRRLAKTEETPSTRTSTHSTHSFNMGFNIHPQIMHFRSNDLARTHLERSHEEPTPECLTGAITEPRELYIEDYTREFITRQNIHSTTIHLEDFCRTKPPNCRDGIEDTQRSLPGVTIKPRKLSLEESTRAFSLYLCIHSKMTYFEGLGRAKLPKEPANWKESNLKQFGRFALSEPTNPDRRHSSHALMFSNTNLKTTCCFRMPKTTRKPAPRNCPRRSHLPYTDLPYLDQGAFKPQRLLSDPLRHELRHNQDLQTVPRHSSFGPKLSRLKPSRSLPYLA